MKTKNANASTQSNDENQTQHKSTPNTIQRQILAHKKSRQTKKRQTTKQIKQQPKNKTAWETHQQQILKARNQKNQNGERIKNKNKHIQQRKQTKKQKT